VVESLRLLLRIVHTGALAIWLGGGALHLIARRALRPAVAPDRWATFDGLFRLWARWSFWALLASGVYLLFDRLADPRLDGGYIAVLGAKLAVVAALWWISGPRTQARQGTGAAHAPDPARVVLALGIVALVLGVALTVLYEGRPPGG